MYQTPPQLTARHMDGVSVCGSDFRSLNVWPLVPWYEVMTTSLGTSELSALVNTLTAFNEGKLSQLQGFFGQAPLSMFGASQPNLYGLTPQEQLERVNADLVTAEH